jgi:hypothetical protein
MDIFLDPSYSAASAAFRAWLDLVVVAQLRDWVHFRGAGQWVVNRAHCTPNALNTASFGSE